MTENIWDASKTHSRYYNVNQLEVFRPSEFMIDSKSVKAHITNDEIDNDLFDSQFLTVFSSMYILNKEYIPLKNIIELATSTLEEELRVDINYLEDYKVMKPYYKNLSIMLEDIGEKINQGNFALNFYFDEDRTYSYMLVKNNDTRN